MNLKNLMMWGVIVLLVVGLFQLFQNPKRAVQNNSVSFSDFLIAFNFPRSTQIKPFK